MHKNRRSKSPSRRPRVCKKIPSRELGLLQNSQSVKKKKKTEEDRREWRKGAQECKQRDERDMETTSGWQLNFVALKIHKPSDHVQPLRLKDLVPHVTGSLPMFGSWDPSGAVSTQVHFPLTHWSSYSSSSDFCLEIIPKWVCKLVGIRRYPSSLATMGRITGFWSFWVSCGERIGACNSVAWFFLQSSCWVDAR